VSPEELRYSKTHEWVRVETQDGQQIATLGITAFALQNLTDLVYLDLAPLGKTLKAGEPFGQVESVKAVSDLYSPVDGEVLQTHTELADADKLARLADDPYNSGWLIKIKVTNPAGLAALMDYATYQKQCEEESDH
jgi:glycine cleavage system H protein